MAKTWCKLYLKWPIQDEKTFATNQQGRLSLQKRAGTRSKLNQTADCVQHIGSTALLISNLIWQDGEEGNGIQQDGAGIASWTLTITVT